MHLSSNSPPQESNAISIVNDGPFFRLFSRVFCDLFYLFSNMKLVYHQASLLTLPQTGLTSASPHWLRLPSDILAQTLLPDRPQSLKAQLKPHVFQEVFVGTPRPPSPIPHLFSKAPTVCVCLFFATEYYSILTYYTCQSCSFNMFGSSLNTGTGPGSSFMAQPRSKNESVKVRTANS